MRIEKGEIPNLQLFFLILCFLQSSHLTATFTYGITKNDTWVCVIAGFIVSLPIVIVYIKLAQRFPGKNLVQIFDIIYGRFIGKVFSLFYILFFWGLVVVNLFYFSSFWLTYIMPETPRIVIIIMFVFACIWAVRCGIEVIARCSFLFVIVTAASILLVSILLIKDMKIAFILPVLNTPVKKLVQSSHIIASIPILEIVVFLMVIPYVNNIKQVKKSVLWALILGVIQLLIIVVRDIVVLGAGAYVTTAPSFSSVRQVNISNVITRLDILYALVLLVTMFIKICVLTYASVLGTAQLFRLKSYTVLVIPLMAIAVNFSLNAFSSNMEQDYIGANIWPFLTIPFEVIIPVISLLMAKIRRLPGKQEGKS